MIFLVKDHAFDRMEPFHVKTRLVLPPIWGRSFEEEEEEEGEEEGEALAQIAP